MTAIETRTTYRNTAHRQTAARIDRYFITPCPLQRSSQSRLIRAQYGSEFFPVPSNPFKQASRATISATRLSLLRISVPLPEDPWLSVIRSPELWFYRLFCRAISSIIFSIGPICFLTNFFSDPGRIYGDPRLTGLSSTSLRAEMSTSFV